MTKAQTLVIRFMSFGSPMHNKYTAMSNKQWWSLWVCLLDDILKPHKNLLKDLKKPHEGFYYCWNSQELLGKLNLLISEPLWSNIWLCLQYFEEITVSWNIRSNQPKAIQTYFHGHFFNLSVKDSKERIRFSNITENQRFILNLITIQQKKLNLCLNYV